MCSSNAFKFRCPWFGNCSLRGYTGAGHEHRAAPNVRLPQTCHFCACRVFGEKLTINVSRSARLRKWHILVHILGAAAPPRRPWLAARGAARLIGRLLRAGRAAEPASSAAAPWTNVRLFKRANYDSPLGFVRGPMLGTLYA